MSDIPEYFFQVIFYSCFQNGSDFGNFRNKIDFTVSNTTGINKIKIGKLLGKGIQLYHDIKKVGANTFSCPEKVKSVA